MDDANTASDNSILTPEESDLPSRSRGSGPTTYYDSEEVEGELQRTMETLRRDVINMVEEAMLENRLAMEENKAMLENNVASIEDKLRKDRAMMEVERSERDRANSAMMEDLRDLREEQKRGQRQTEAGLLSIETRLLRAITNTREVSPGAVAQPTGNVPRHSSSKRTREAEPSRVSAHSPRRPEGKQKGEYHCHQESLPLPQLVYR